MSSQVTIATQTDEPVIPILPLAKHLVCFASCDERHLVRFSSYNAEVIREEWGIGTQTDALREPISLQAKERKEPVPEISSMKRFLDEFNEESFSETEACTNPKRFKYNPPKAPSRLVTDSLNALHPSEPSAKNVVKDDDPVREPSIDLSLGKVPKAFVRRMRMIAVIDHYEEKGRIRDLHIMTLQKRFSRDFKGEKEYSISGIRELLRSKGFGLNKYDRVKNFKRRVTKSLTRLS